MFIRKNDQVVLIKAITGAKQVDRRAVGKEEKGSIARVRKVLPESNRIIVEGVNYVYRHVRRSRKHPQGGRIAQEAPIDASNVMLYCPKCNGPARIRKQVMEKKDAPKGGRRQVLRVCKRCGETLGRSG